MWWKRMVGRLKVAHPAEINMKKALRHKRNSLFHGDPRSTVRVKVSHGGCPASWEDT